MEHSCKLFSQQALELLSPLGAVLYHAIEPSVEDARAYFKERTFDAYLFANLTRYHTCCRLKEMPLPVGVEFVDLPNNGMQFLCNGCLVRVWKADNGSLPGPGNSKSKQDYFDQPFLISPDPVDARFAVLWDYDFETGLLKLDLACPKRFEEDAPWRSAEAHFYLAFPHVATTIAAQQSTEAVEDIELEPTSKAQLHG